MPDACGFHMLLQLCAKTFAKLSHRALAKSKHDLHLVPGSDFALEVVGSDLSEGRRRIDAAGNDSMGFTNPPSLTRTSAVWGKGVSLRVNLGGRRYSKKKN